MTAERGKVHEVSSARVRYPAGLADGPGHAGAAAVGHSPCAGAGRPPPALVQRRQRALSRALPRRPARAGAGRGACRRARLPAHHAIAAVAAARPDRGGAVQRSRPRQRLHHAAALQQDRRLPGAARQRRAARQQRLARPVAGARVHARGAPGQGAQRARCAADDLRPRALVHAQPVPARLGDRGTGGLQRERTARGHRPPARALLRGLAARRARAASCRWPRSTPTAAPCR